MTGANGFIGRWSVPPLVAAGYEVHAVMSPRPRPELGPMTATSAATATTSTAATPTTASTTTAASPTTATGAADDTTTTAVPAQLDGARVHIADLLDGPARDALLDAVMPSHLLHFAWIATPGIYRTSALNFRWLAASRELLHRFHAIGGRRAVMAGSCAEYDWSHVDVCHERTSPLAGPAARSASAYTECKIGMQKALEEFGRDTGLSTAWGRIFFQFGPDEHIDRLVPSVITHLLTGREAPPTQGRQIRSFLHVSDVGSAFAALLDSVVQGPLNIGSDEPIAIGDLVMQIAAAVGRPDLIEQAARESPSQGPAVLLPAVERLRQELGWRPRLTLRAGLIDAIHWWRQALRDRSVGIPR